MRQVLPALRGGLAPRAPALLCLAALLALALLASGCGGDGGGETSEPATTTQTATAPGQGAGSEGQGAGGEREAPESQQPSPGGERSLQTYGSEARGAERAAISTAFEAYLRAVAAEDFATACNYLAESVKDSLQQFARQGLGGKGCAAILPNLLAPTAAAIAREQVNGEIAQVRVEGDRAFVLFHAPGAKLYLITMSREGGEWKAALVAASIVVPDL